MSAPPRWYLVPARILLVTFLATLLSFAVGLLCGIVGIFIKSRLQGIHPNMSMAYLHVAAPVAAVAAIIALLSMSILEINNYRQSKTLAAVERASR